MGNYLSPKTRLMAVASAAALAGLAVVAVLIYLLLPSPTSFSALPGAKPPDEYINSFGMKLKYIKPGTFLMGSPQGEVGQSDDEKPQHLVEITRPFYLGVYPVTQEEYVRVTGQTNPSWFSKEGGGRNRVENMDTSKFPVEQVTWEDAADFCRCLIDWTRRGPRLGNIPCRAKRNGSTPAAREQRRLTFSAAISRVWTNTPGTWATPTPHPYGGDAVS